MERRSDVDWITCSERLPEKDIKVLCYYYDEYMDVMEYLHDDENGNPQFYNLPYPPFNCVTHLMPLPSPPQNK